MVEEVGWIGKNFAKGDNAAVTVGAFTGGFPDEDAIAGADILAFGGPDVCFGLLDGAEDVVPVGIASEGPITLGPWAAVDLIDLDCYRNGFERARPESLRRGDSGR